MQVTKAGRRKNGELLFSSYRIFVAGKDEKVLDIASGDGYTLSWMYLMPSSFTVTDS